MHRFALPMMLLLAGCTMVWVRPHTSAEQTHDDYAYCEIAAYGKHPENMVRIESDSRRFPSHIEDANITVRDEETKYCMRAQGYLLQRPWAPKP